ncbi:MAG: hypothetical protein ABSA40_07745 [Candidatus Dormibacteria bacterium]
MLGGEENDQPATPGTPRNVYQSLRSQALAASPSLAGFTSSGTDRVVYGAVMDWAMDRVVVTVLALEDGTGSVYLSTGGAVIGGGFHEPVRQAVRAFILAFEPFVDRMVADHDPQPPPQGCTDLRALTTRGRLVARAPTAEFGEGPHPMSGVFHAGQGVITVIRQLPPVAERRRPDG